MASNPPQSKPAKPDPRDDAFLREVDEEYRRDEMNKLARRYGKPALIAVLLGLLAFGGFLFWRSEQAKARAERGEAYLQAMTQLQNGNSTEAVKALQPIAASKDPGYRALALLAQAAVAARGGDTQRAVGLYRAVADDAALEGPFRDLARIKATRLEFDTLAPAEVIRRLQPYAQPGNPWFGVAGELTALAHLKAKQPDRAGQIFIAIAQDRAVAESLRARAEQMASSLGQDTTKILAATAVPAAKG